MSVGGRLGIELNFDLTKTDPSSFATSFDPVWMEDIFGLCQKERK